MSDAKLLSGWVRTFGRQTLVVSLTTPSSVSPGEEFIFQVFGTGSVAMFRGVLTHVLGRELTFGMASEVQVVKSSESRRILLQSITGVLDNDGRSREVIIADISEGGAGLICSDYIDPATKIELKIDGPGGQVVLSGQVRYCKAIDETITHFRLGVTLSPQNRIDVARWQRLLESEAA